MHDHAIHEAIVANTAAVSALTVVLGKLTARLDADVATKTDIRDLGHFFMGAIDALRDEVHGKSLAAVAGQTAKLNKSSGELKKAVDQSKPE